MDQNTTSQVLYRKYRPQNLDEIVGQPHITRTLKNAFKEGFFAHAYFFTGPKGTGKTSTARIIAKTVNCTSKAKKKPCDKCEICLEIAEGRALDLIEIDAASNRGIDEIRELRDKVHFPPTKSNYKVYIIDEVHMLTTEASNALLKTLEEPPKHAIFVLCTTEPHKVPKTIISRCQRFDFKRASLKDLVKRLKQISEKEKVELESDALNLIAQNASGGFRDAETLLDQVLAYIRAGKKGKASIEMVQEILGLADIEEISRLIDDVIAKNLKEGLFRLNQIIESGADPLQFIRSLIEHLRGVLLVKNGLGEDLVEVTKEQYQKMHSQAERIEAGFLVGLIERFTLAENELKDSQIPQLPIELAIIDSIGEEEESGVRSQNTEYKSPSFVKNSEDKRELEDKNREEINKKTKQSSKKPSSGNIPPISKIVEKWPEVLKTVKPHNHSVEAFLKASKPVALEDDFLTLGFFYSFHKERIEDRKNRDLIEAVIEEIFGVKLKVKCTLNDRKKKEDQLLETAQKVFSGKMIN